MTDRAHSKEPVRLNVVAGMSTTETVPSINGNLSIFYHQYHAEKSAWYKHKITISRARQQFLDKNCARGSSGVFISHVEAHDNAAGDR
jgi:hypothetical protein